MTFDPHRRVVVIVAAVESTPNLVERIRALQCQVAGRGRVIVVDGTGDQAVVGKASTFPAAIPILASEAGTLAPELWGQGIQKSTEPIIVLTTSQMIPRAGWLDAGIDRLLESGSAGVGGPIEPADLFRPLDRAIYLLRYLNYSTPLRESANPEPPGDNAFYRREMLGEIEGGFWEAEIHRDLRARGHGLLLDADAVVEFHGGSTFAAMLRQRFLHAWRYGSGRSRRFGVGQKLTRSLLAPLVPCLLTARIFRTLLRKQLPLGRWLPAFPWLLPLLLVWTLGELLGVWILPPGPKGLGASDHHSNLPSVTLKDEDQPMNSEPPPIGFLVVGAGFLGAQRAAAVSVLKSTRLVSVCDVDGKAAMSVAKRHGAVDFTDFDQALAHPGIDAVIVASPHADHFSQVLRAIEAGKNVLCEKPLAIRPNEARELAMRADERRVRLATGFNHRFYPPIRDALAMTQTGAIGRIESVRAEIGHMASAEFLQGWHTDLARSGGGTLMDNGPHACDLIRQFLGEIVGAKGYVRNGSGLPEGCESEAFALFRDFDHGFAELRSSWTQPRGYLTLQIRGASGWLRIDTAPWSMVGVLSNGKGLSRTYLGERVADRLHRVRFGCERSLVDELAAFVGVSAPLARREATGWDGCRATEMISAVYQSHATGAETVLEPPLVLLPSSARRRTVEARGS